MGLLSWYRNRKAKKQAAEDAYWDHVWGDVSIGKKQEETSVRKPFGLENGLPMVKGNLRMTATADQPPVVSTPSNPNDLTNMFIIAALMENNTQQQSQPSPDIIYSQPTQTQVETNSTPQDTPVSSSDPVTTMPSSSYDTPSSYDPPSSSYDSPSYDSGGGSSGGDS